MKTSAERLLRQEPGMGLRRLRVHSGPFVVVHGIGSAEFADET
jgi:hypothetical protein